MSFNWLSSSSDQQQWHFLRNNLTILCQKFSTPLLGKPIGQEVSNPIKHTLTS